MKHMANIISVFRIVLSTALFFQKPLSTGFFVFYSLCGISDIADGCAARCFKAKSSLGAMLDSVADIAFLSASARVLFPILKFKKFIIVLMLAVLLIRITGIIIGFIVYKRLILLHTVAEKITGLLLFASVYFIERIDINILALPLCAAAGLAAVQEVILILKTKNKTKYYQKEKSGLSF